MYDVILIGGGPGGYKTAELCKKRGLSVALIEKEALGGTCLNQGCIPFKTYLHVAKNKHEAEKKTKMELLSCSRMTINQERLLKYKNSVVNGLQQSVKVMLQSCGVDYFEGKGDVVSRDDKQIIVETGSGRIEGKTLVIATGSEEKRIPIPDNLPYKVMYSKEMLEQSLIPDNVIIIGGGVIGLEAASFYADSGCEVTIIEAAEHLGGHIDEEIASAIEQILEKKGISVKTNTYIKGLDFDGVVCDHFGKSQVINSQCVLIAIGREPYMDTCSLYKLGVTYDKKGVIIDDSCRTNMNNVYACGDVTGKMMLAHTAYYQAKVITDNICGKHSKIDYSFIPRIIYANPEILSVGVCEDECEGTQYTAKCLPMTYSGRYYAENGKDGAKAKMIVNEKCEIIGFHMIGNGASEISLAAEMMIRSKMKVEDIRNLVFAHPTYVEIISELAGLF